MRQLAAWAAAALVVLTFAHPATAAEEYDPWERMNRGVFWFNDKLDVYLLEPVAKGWDFVLPDRFQGALSDAFANLRFPINFANELFQGKPRAAGVTVARFLLNSSLGMAGLFDVAAAAGLPRREEDFGQTLGVWGLGNGPYLVLPLLGPSTVRDTGGRVVDWPLRVWPFFVGTVPSLVISGTDAVNWRSLHIEEIRDLKKDAFDYYALVRNAYIQNRAAEVADHAETTGSPDQTDADDLYFSDEEE